MLQNIRVVLVETSHPGNIGAVARAMKNMDLQQLVLVRPKVFPSPEAVARASGAEDLLAGAMVVDDLESAIADCPLVIGASARKRSEIWTPMDPREMAGMVLAQARTAPVALVFGRERTGLTAEELDRCSHLVQIPANPQHASLNIAMAVQVLAYELYVACRPEVASAGEGGMEPATAGQMEGLFEHLQQTLLDIGFLQPGREGKILQRLRRLFYRARPDAREVNILRGILSAAQGGKSMRRQSGDAPGRRTQETSREAR
ncbi:MAG: RNA methyltransferase [Gammaproteobacteria bacterium]|nr:MAG: RNA methyltransferase [Gammaproteobacteria bacterium]